MTFAQVQNGSAITGSTSGGVTTVTLTLPVASTAGTLLVACLVAGEAGTPYKISTVTTTGGSNPNTSPGWEWCCTSVNGSGNGGQQVEIWAYRNNPGGVTSTTWTYPSSQGGRGHLMEFSTTSTWQVMELFPGLNTAVTAGATSFPVAMATPVGAGELAVAMFGDNFSAGTTLTWTTPSGWTLGKSTTTGGTIQMHWASYWQATAAAGTVSVTGAASTAVNQVGWEAAVVVFREAAAVRSRVGASCSPGTYTDQASFGFTPGTKTGSAKEFDSFVGRTMAQSAQTSYQQEGAHLTTGPTNDLLELTAMGAQVFWSLKPRRTGLSGFTTVAAEQAALDQDLTLVKQAGITGFICGIFNEFQLGGANGPFGNDTNKQGSDPYGTGNTDATAKQNWLTYWANYQPTLAAHGIPAYTVPTMASPKAASSWQPPARTVSGVMAHYYFDAANGAGTAIDASPGTGVPALQDICDGVRNPDNTVPSPSNPPIPLGVGETGRAGGSSTPAWSEVVGWSANGTWTDAGTTKTANGPRKLFAARITANKQNGLLIWFENNLGGPNWIHTPGVNGEDQSGIQAELAAWADNLAPVAAPPVVVTTTALPNGALTVTYSQQLQVSGGAAPYTWALATGALPTGLSLSSAGVISGTPSAGGTFTFTVTATDAGSNVGTSGSLSIFVPAMAITTTSLNPASFGVPYSQTLTETGGTGPFTWAVTSGTLPAGLALSAAGVLSGTTAGAVGPYPVTVTLLDSAGNTAQAAYTLTVTAGGTGGGTPVQLPAGFPQLIVEAGFYAAAPVAPPGTLILDDPVNGLLGTGTLADSTAWTDITTYIRSGTVTRTSTRVQGPLLTYQASTATVTLKNGDGRFDPDNASGPYVIGGVSGIRPMVPVRARAVYGGAEYHLFSGFIDTWGTPDTNFGPHYAETQASATDGFKILAGITLPPTGALGAGEMTGTRISRILSNAGWYTDHRRIDTGNSTVQSTTYGDTVLNLLQLTADSEVGELYIDGSGNVVFRHRLAAVSDARSTTSQATFSDDGIALPYLGVGRANDDTTLANDVQITINGSQNMQEAQNPASIAKYLFPRSYSRSDIILQSDAEAGYYAQWVLYVSLSGEDRFDTLTLSPLRDPRLWPQALGREIGDRITVTRTPPGMAAITKDVFIRGITHAIDASSNTWQTTWDLQDASKYTGFLILDDPNLGKVSSGNKLAY